VSEVPPFPRVPPMPTISALLTAASVAAPLLAQADGPAQPPPDFLRTLVQTLPIALVVLAAYLLLFRPEKEKIRRQQELLTGLKKNDRVVTSGGIYGTIANVDRDADRVTLKIDDAANVKITVTLTSIARVLDRGAAGDADPSRTPRDEA
jgi:preprotein translocase subunit YajC